MQTKKYALQFFRRILLTLPVAVCIGSLVAFFLWLLEIATHARERHLWLILLLPLAGVFITLLYQRFGKNIHAGNSLIIKEIYQPKEGVPIRMTPLILFSTIITHLFGGSAGREGTALQIGGSISSLFSKWYQLKQEDTRILLRCGIAAGFGAVFGTPITGAVFALEWLIIGKVKYNAFIPCIIASIVAHITCVAWGIQHTQYAITSFQKAISYFSFEFFLLLKVIVAGIAFGLSAYIFILSAHHIKEQSEKHIQKKWLIPVIGGALIIAISYLLGTVDYLGLGVTSPNPTGVSIVSAFSYGGAIPFSWLWKILLTSITLGMGFKGGEVTPLFFIGATLGNTIAVYTGSPVDLFAGLGFIAVFAAGTKTPLACTLMGVELFGAEHVIYYAVVCFTAYFFSGKSGIYKTSSVETL